MHLQTRKQLLYFKEVIQLRYEYGYGEDRISRILPLGHSTVSRWLAIFAAENDVKSEPMRKRKKATHPSPEVPAGSELKTLEREVSRLQTELKTERLRADAYEEMIKVAETKFKIAIRKKAGAKR
ncbi:MAG: transposase [Prevotellaceae bacterium]|jgi:hypothetical protein|nr:transposase [Prevotellaceae bacterium]